MPLRNFCTLFDTGFLSRGLTLYHSLYDIYQQNFHLYIFAFDTESYALLKTLNLPCVTVIDLKSFEDAELLAIKPTRTRGEYCWTCTPSVILYCLEKFALSECTYLDADLYFFSSPEPIFEEMGEASVLITPHRYLPAYDQSSTSGIYCVQFLVFRADERGLRVLRWWRQSCLDWCYARHEDGKFGDQKYLDDWTERFEGVHVLTHLGGGVAPWNSDFYVFNQSSGKLQGMHKQTSETFEVIFFHFHGVRFFSSPRKIEKMKAMGVNLKTCLVDLAHYPLSKTCLKDVYRPYFKALMTIDSQLKKLTLLDVHAVAPVEYTLIYFLRLIKRTLLGVCHHYRFSRFVP